MGSTLHWVGAVCMNVMRPKPWMDTTLKNNWLRQWTVFLGIALKKIAITAGNSSNIQKAKQQMDKRAMFWAQSSPSDHLEKQSKSPACVRYEQKNRGSLWHRDLAAALVGCAIRRPFDEFLITTKRHLIWSRSFKTWKFCSAWIEYLVHLKHSQILCLRLTMV